MQYNSWNCISVSQFCELKSFRYEDFESDTDFVCNIISLVQDKSLDEVYQIPITQLKQLRKEMEFTIELPKRKHKTVLEVEGEKLYLLPNLKALTVGEFVDLEYYFTNDYFKNLRLICAILYRRKIKEQTVFETEVFEPYGNYIYLREHLFDDFNIQDVYGVVNYYLDWRNKIYTNYAPLFQGADDSEITKEELEQADLATRHELQQELQHQQRLKKWSWDLFIDRIRELYGCSDEEAYNLNIISVLNLMARKVEMNAA